MQIMTCVREDQVRGNLPFQQLKIFLDVPSSVGKEPIAKALNHDFFVPDALQKRVCAF